MTATPSMATKTTVAGVMLACIGAAALLVLMQMNDEPRTGGWRNAVTTPAAMAAPVQTRGTHATGIALPLSSGEISTARGRN